LRSHFTPFYLTDAIKFNRLVTDASVQVEDHLETSTREERQGLAVEGIPDADLFYVDKVI
jgi:hypothetical protein